MLYCSNCGKRIPDDAQFCSYCGAKARIHADDATVDPSEFGNPFYGTSGSPGFRPSPMPAVPVVISQTHPEKSSSGRRKTGIIIAVIALVLFFALLVFAFYLMMSSPLASPSAASSVQPHSGDILAFESNGIKIYFSCWKGATRNSSPGVELLVKNHSGKEITVKVADAALDGNSMNGILYENLSNGVEKYATVFFKKEDLDAVGIIAPSSVQMKFVVVEQGSGNPVCSSEILRVKTK